VSRILDKNFATPIHLAENIDKERETLRFSSNGNSYVLECLTSIEQMQQVASEWKCLEKKSEDHSIYFQSYDWCYKWCVSFASKDEGNPQHQMKIYILRSNDELIMVWPMMLVKSRANINKLTFLSSPHAQYSNIIYNKELFSVDVGKKIWKYIRSTSKADVIILDQYPLNSLLKEIIAKNGIVEKSQIYASILNLDGFATWEEYQSSLSRNQRKQRRQRRNRISKLGELSFEIHYGGSDRYKELVELALRWKQVWLHEEGRRATLLSKESTKEFLLQLAGNNRADGNLDSHHLPNGAVLGVLSVDSTPVGIEIGMCLNGHYYCYLGAFEWEYRHLSPGKIQMEESQMWAKKVGMQKFDLLCDPAEYKSKWSNQKEAFQSRSVPITMRGFFYCTLWKAYISPAIRLIFAKLNAKSRAKLLNITGVNKINNINK